MSAIIYNKRNAIVCDCSECGEMVDITPYSGFDAETEDIDCEWSCADCGKIVCEGCYQDFHDVCFGDPEDDDHGKMCSACFEKLERKVAGEGKS